MSRGRSKTLAIIGQGYVGLPLAMAAVRAGWKVIGIDNLEIKVSQINSGSSPVEDVSNEQLQMAISEGNYNASTDVSRVSEASIVAFCVPTPLGPEREPDLTILSRAVTEVAPYVLDETLVVSESTSYPGTLRNFIIPLIHSLKPNDSVKVYFASAPERVNPGDHVWNQKNTPRLIGGIDSESQAKAISFYDSICDVAISVSSPEVAEAAKLLENTFRLINIALVNEFTQLCSLTEINVHEVIDAASTKPYGFMPFRPSVGVGGHCIPVDPMYLAWWARQNGGIASFVELADLINLNMPKFVAQRAIDMIDMTITKPRVLILGVAYKSGVADVRETPVSVLRSYLMKQGVEVSWYDPLVKDWEGTEPADLSKEYDLAILATNQPEMDIKRIIATGIPILDCTNSLKNQKGVSSI
jgi:UDP-N-acetyl-D-glucosamine dehydrogenase